MEALSWPVRDTEGETLAQCGSLPPTDVSWQRALPQMEVNTPVESYSPEGALLAASCGNRAGVNSLSVHCSEQGYLFHRVGTYISFSLKNTSR